MKHDRKVGRYELLDDCLNIKESAETEPCSLKGEKKITRKKFCATSWGRGGLIGERIECSRLVSGSKPHFGCYEEWT